MAGRTYLIPTQEGFSEESYRQLINAVQNLFSGASNITKDGALSVGTSTVVQHPQLHKNSVITLMPTNADAGSVLSGHYITPGDKQATITHSTAAGTETFAWTAQG